MPVGGVKGSGSGLRETIPELGTNPAPPASWRTRLRVRESANRMYEIADEPQPETYAPRRERTEDDRCEMCGQRCERVMCRLCDEQLEGWAKRRAEEAAFDPRWEKDE